MDNLEIKSIDFNTAKKFITENHYSHSCTNSAISTFGLFNNDELIGACIFTNTSSKTAKYAIFKDKNNIAELHRLYIKDVTPCNTESWFISKCLKLLKINRTEIDAVITFADETEGHIGIIYQATNAIYYGATTRNTFYIDKEKRLRHPRQVGGKANGRRLGLKISNRLTKHRYLWLLGSSFKKKYLKSKLTINIQPYPTFIKKSQCSKCLKFKLADEFSPDKKAKNGLQSQCKLCRKKYMKLKRKLDDVNNREQRF